MTGSLNEMLFFNQVPENFDDNLAMIDELGGPTDVQPLPVGLDLGRQHAVPPLEARDVPRRRDRPVRRLVAGEDRGPRRSPQPVRPRNRPGADRSRRPWCRAAGRRPWSHPSTDRRGQLRHSFDAADAPTSHTTQYFEMFGHRAIYHDGWRAVCPWPGPNFTEAAAMGRRLGDPITPEVLEQLDASGWELYDINDDPTESSNIAAEHPDRLRELIALWWKEAEKYKVLPLDGSLQARLKTERPQTSRPRTRFIYRPHTSLVPAFAAPPVYNRPHSIEADVEIPADGASGVLIAQGGDAGGYTFFVEDGRPRYVYNYVGREKFEVSSSEPLLPGRHAVRYEFEPTGQPDFKVGKGVPGRAQLYIDGRLVGNADFPYTTPLLFELEGLSCGYDFGAPATETYQPPFTFTGTIHSVTVEVSGELIRDDDAEIARLMAQQ